MPPKTAATPAGEMPFLDHLEELRWRIIWSLVALVVGTIIGFLIVLHWDVIVILERPIRPYLHDKKLVYTHPGDPFQIILNAGITTGFVLALPVIVMQIWAFLAPALHRHEKRIAMSVLAGGVVLFASGVALAYFVVLPLALPWLMGFEVQSLEPMITVSEYFGFVFSLLLAFGAAFELPIVIIALAAVGIVTPEFLSKYRRHAVVLVVIIGAFFTPGDLIYTTIAMAIPLYLLYELSVIVTYFIYRKRRKAARLAERAAAAEG